MADERNRELERAAAAGDPEARAALSQARRRQGASASFPGWRALWERGADLFAPAQLVAGINGLLAADLAPLGPDLAARAQRFVEDGRDPGVLDALAAEPGVGAGLELALRRDPAAEVRPRDLLRALRDPVALLRLGLVYDALGGPPPERFPPEPLERAGVPRWLVALAFAAERRAAPSNPFNLSSAAGCVLSWPTVEALLAAARLGGEGLLVTLLDLNEARTRLRLERPLEVLAACPGLGEALAGRYAERVREALLEEGPAVARACALLTRHGVSLPPFADALATAATRPRSHAEAWQAIAAAPPSAALTSALANRLEHSRAGVRRLAVRCLQHLEDPRAVAPLERAATQDRSAEVRRAAAGALRARGDTPAPLAAAPALPPLAALASEARAHLDLALTQAGVAEQGRAHALDALAQREAWAGSTDAAGASLLGGAWAGVLAQLPREPEAHAARLRPLAEGLDLPRVVRLLRLVGHLSPSRKEGWEALGFEVLDLLSRERLSNAEGRWALEALAQALPYAGLAAERLGACALEPRTLRAAFSVAAGWDASAYYLRRPGLIDEALRGGLTATAGVQVWASRLLAELEAALLAMPRLESSWIEALIELGTDSAKAKREFAQRVLDGSEVDLTPPLVAQLGARKGDRRVNAARWLARRGLRAALPALRAAAEAEGLPKVARALREAREQLEAQPPTDASASA